MSEVLGGSPGASWKETRGDCSAQRLSKMQIFRFTDAENFAILPHRQFNSFAFVALLARVRIDNAT